MEGLDAGGAADGLELLATLDRAAERFATPCGEGRMAWRAWGEGEHLVLLHGGYGAWSHWLRNIGPLSRRYRVIAADLPGLGDSDMPPVPYTPESLGAVIDAGIDAVVPGGARFHLAGFSFGAMLGGQVAARRGEQVRSFTLVGAGAMGLPREPMELARVTRRMGAEEVAAIQRANLGLLMLKHPESIDETAVHLQVTNVDRARVKSRTFSRGHSLAEALPRVRAPLNGIWGEYDQTAHPWLHLREEFLRRIQPDVRFRVIPGAGHWVQYEAAAEFNRTLLEVLAECDGVAVA
jgi:pimeloyl-ACP methyl ester carboxylesterase